MYPAGGSAEGGRNGVVSIVARTTTREMLLLSAAVNYAQRLNLCFAETKKEKGNGIIMLQ